MLTIGQLAENRFVSTSMDLDLSLPPEVVVGCGLLKGSLLSFMFHCETLGTNQTQVTRAR